MEEAVIELSAVEQARLLKRRERSSEELVRVYLERIARLVGRLCAFVSVVHRSALRAGRRIDRVRRQRGEGLPHSPDSQSASRIYRARVADSLRIAHLP